MLEGGCTFHCCAWREGILPVPVADTTDTFTLNDILLIVFSASPQCKWGFEGMFTLKNIVKCRDTRPGANILVLET